MKLRFLIPALAAVLAACACIDTNAEGEEDGGEETAGLKNPGLTVSGLPSDQILAESAFNLTVKSSSEAPVSFTCSAPKELVSVNVTAKRVYRVKTGIPDNDTEVVISFSQDEMFGYEAASKEVRFTLKKKEDILPPDPPAPDEELTGTRIVFEESMEPITNPERGYYRSQDFRTSTSALSVSTVKAQRKEGRTLMYLGFYLTDFMDGDGVISEEFMKKIQDSMDALREGGSKCILRFAYQSSESSTPWDATEEIVLRHVAQLKPLLQKNEDVIFVLQAGFVGVWGEWYYTTNFIKDPRTDEDYLPRRHLVDALLEALPASRQIQLRTPQFKMRLFGLTVADTLTAATAHDGSVLSRIAGHNDCFGASVNDYGTFDNERDDREFWKGDSRHMIMGGETCRVSDYCVCEATLKDMEDYHWTYLNSGYNNDVIARWKTAGCYDETVRRLGYRLVLQDAYYTENPKAGEKFDLALRIYNRGFAAPQNPRNANLVFIDGNGVKSVFPLGSDPRSWYSGLNVIKTSFTLPSEKGTLYLDLSDPLLPDRPEYSIALADKGVFDEATGLNKILELK